MHSSVNNLLLIKEQLNKKILELILFAVVKNFFSINKISPLLDFEHCHFGENKIQEALDKWTDFKKKK